MEYYKFNLPKLVKYKIIIDDDGFYYVAIWQLWFPFWIINVWNSHLSLEAAIEAVEKRKILSKKPKYKTVKKL